MGTVSEEGALAFGNWEQGKVRREPALVDIHAGHCDRVGLVSVLEEYDWKGNRKQNIKSILNRHFKNRCEME